VITWIDLLGCSVNLLLFLFQTYVGERIEPGVDVPHIADSCG